MSSKKNKKRSSSTSTKVVKSKGRRKFYQIMAIILSGTMCVGALTYIIFAIFGLL